MFAIAPTSGGGVAIIALIEVINPDVDKEPQMSSTQLVLGALSVLLMATSANGLDGPAMNGARIYFTGTSERGTTATPANTHGGMMHGDGQWLTCASCHGPQGRGGSHVMHMWAMTAPDIRYVALRNMSELKGRQRPYDIDDFRQQVEKGLHPDGTEVAAQIPRWQMSDADLTDLFTYLKALSQ